MEDIDSNKLTVIKERFKAFEGTNLYNRVKLLKCVWS
jgi:hypothetical protein